MDALDDVEDDHSAASAHLKSSEATATLDSLKAERSDELALVFSLPTFVASIMACLLLLAVHDMVLLRTGAWGEVGMPQDVHLPSPAVAQPKVVEDGDDDVLATLDAGEDDADGYQPHPSQDYSLLALESTETGYAGVRMEAGASVSALFHDGNKDSLFLVHQNETVLRACPAAGDGMDLILGPETTLHTTLLENERINSRTATVDDLQVLDGLTFASRADRTQPVCDQTRRGMLWSWMPLAVPTEPPVPDSDDSVVPDATYSGPGDRIDVCMRYEDGVFRWRTVTAGELPKNETTAPAEETPTCEPGHTHDVVNVTNTTQPAFVEHFNLTADLWCRADATGTHVECNHLTPSLVDVLAASSSDMFAQLKALILSPSSIGTEQLAAQAVGSDQLAAQAVLSTHIQASSVEGGHIADGAISAAHLQPDIISEELLQAQSVTSSKLASESVNGWHLANQSVSSRHLATGVIDRSKLQPGIITADHLDGAIIGTDELVDQSVTGDKIVPSAITSEHLAAESVEREHVQPGAVDESRLADQSVSAAKVNASEVQLRVSGACVAGSFITRITAAGTVECGSPPPTPSIPSAHGHALFTSPGNYTFTVPAQVTHITVQCQGAGGAGGSIPSLPDDGCTPAAAGGGGGGAFLEAELDVTQGLQFTVVVGAGGQPQLGEAGSGIGMSGEASKFGDGLVAFGGASGSRASSGTGGEFDGVVFRAGFGEAGLAGSGNEFFKESGAGGGPGSGMRAQTKSVSTNSAAPGLDATLAGSGGSGAALVDASQCPQLGGHGRSGFVRVSW